MPKTQPSTVPEITSLDKTKSSKSQKSWCELREVGTNVAGGEGGKKSAEEIGVCFCVSEGPGAEWSEEPGRGHGCGRGTGSPPSIRDTLLNQRHLCPYNCILLHATLPL